MTDVRPTASMGWPQRLLVGLGILGALSFILIAGIIIYSFSFNFQPRPRPEIETRAGAETMVIGPIAEVPGTNLTALTIMKTERSGGKLSSYTQEDQRNVILLDRNTGSTRRLLPDNKHRIFGYSFLPARATLEPAGDDGGSTVRQANGTAIFESEASSKAPAAYYLLKLASGAEDETKNVVVGIIATNAQATVMTGIDDIEQQWMLSATQIGLIVREKRQLFYRVIDVPSLKVSKSTMIDIG